MKLIQIAKFFAGAGGSLGYNDPIAQAAHVSANGLVLMSKVPESAAEAERINAAVKEYIKRKK